MTLEPAFYGDRGAKKRSGFIYLVRNQKAFPGWVKLGHTENFAARIDKYRCDMPPPYRDSWEVVGLWQVRYPDLAEAYLLDLLIAPRHGQSEWYRPRQNINLRVRIDDLLIKERAFRARGIDTAPAEMIEEAA